MILLFDRIKEERLLTVVMDGLLCDSLVFGANIRERIVVKVNIAVVIAAHTEL